MIIEPVPQPKGIVNAPQLPLPWQPDERFKITNKIYTDNLPDCLPFNSGQTIDERGNSLREYIKDIRNRYIIEGVGVFAVQKAMGHLVPNVDALYGIYETERNWREVQEEFEQEGLGLPPSSTENISLSQTDNPYFNGRLYPIEPLAKLINTSDDELQATLHDKQATKFGGLILRFSNYIIPVVSTRNDHRISAGVVTKLTPVGASLIDTALTIAEGAAKHGN